VTPRQSGEEQPDADGRQHKHRRRDRRHTSQQGMPCGLWLSAYRACAMWPPAFL